MDPRLLRYYSRELQFIREMGGEFAKQYPKIAGRLGMDGMEVSDPYVERLLEGFAFLAARVQLKMDDEFPRVSQHLLEMVYPHYLAPLPSMAVVQLQPSLKEGALAAGVLVPRGSVMRSLLGKDEQTACEYRTAHDVTLYPLELAKAEYRAFLGALDDLPLPELARAKAVVRLVLRATAGLKIDKIALDRLPLFLRGDPELSGRIYEALLGHAIAGAARPAKKSGPWRRLAGDRPVGPLGFEDHQSLIPYGARSFHGHRLLQEYFAFPQRFQFAELQGLRPAVEHCPESELEVLLLLDAHDAGLESAFNAAQLALFATPAINLFPRRADRIHLSDAQHEYHVIPDRTRPMDFEVYSVDEVSGFGVAGESKRRFAAFYQMTEAETDDAYYTIRREPRRLSERQRAQGPRSSYVGSEVFITLVDGDEGPFRSQLKQIGLETMCTNRDLPLQMPVGLGRTDFNLESGAPVDAIRCIAGPTPPRASHAHGDTTWRLISQLSLGYTALSDGGDRPGAAALRELLSLYGDTAEASVKKLVEGVQTMASRSVVRRVPGTGPIAFGRGVEVTVTCDESSFQGAGVYMFGSVLERFFAKAVSINSFTETVLRTIQRGEVKRWPARIGLTRVF